MIFLKKKGYCGILKTTTIYKYAIKMNSIEKKRRKDIKNFMIY